MPAQKISCPSCQSGLQIQQTLPTKARCPRCSGHFSIAVNGATAALPRLPASQTMVNRLPVIGLIVGGGLLFLSMGGVLVALCLLVGRGGPAEPDEQEMPSIAKKPKQVILEPVCFLKPGPKKTDGPIALSNQGKPPSDEAAGTAKPICSEAALPENQAEIDAAIDKGVAFLKAGLNNQGHFPGDANSNRLGGIALIGLTLLSCDVPADDPKIAGILQRVRKEAPGMTQTYDLSTCIWFLDKVGDPSDRALIQKMALRLMAGQTVAGGWDYGCKVLNNDEELELLRVLQEQPYQRLPIIVPEAVKKDGAPQQPEPGTPAANLVKNLPVVRFQAGHKLATAADDNSNTQFAVLGLWAAQKHGIPAQRSLAMVEARFRQTQSPKGTWTYRDPRYSDSMTCAGLIGLAVGHGLAQPKGAVPASPDNNLAKDPQIEKALLYLGNRLPQLHLTLNHAELIGMNKEINGILSKLKLAKGDEKTALTKRVQELQRIRQKVLSQLKSQAKKVDALGELYFLWSLERVAVIYGLRTIGGTDWYAWGAEILIVGQEDNGGWRNQHGMAADTCFALLFLKRANVAQDLTKVLQGLGGARDPGAPPGTPNSSHTVSQSEIKDEPDVAPGRVKTRTGYKAPAKT
jgi:hypothetical protein